MSLRAPIDLARDVPRLWWLMLAGVAARFTAERPLTQAASGFLFWLLVMVLCALMRTIVRRGPYGEVRVQRLGSLVAILGVGLALARLETRGWLSALLVLLLAVQAGAFIAATKRLHVWIILTAAFGVLLLSAAQTHSPLFLPCAACFTFMALGLLASNHHDQRAGSAAFAATALEKRPGGGFAFVSFTLLLAIPVYLFVPKPGNSGEAPEAIRTSNYRETTLPIEPPPPPIPADLAGSTGEEMTDAPPSASEARSIEGARRIARPETGDYGEDFVITDVQRRTSLANELVLYARSSHQVNLRGRVYDRFAANRWSRTLTTPRRVELNGRSLVLVSQPAGPTLVEQTLEIALDLNPVLVHAPGMQQLRYPASSLLLYEDGVVATSDALRADTLYSVESRLALLDGRYLLQEPRPADIAPYLQVDAASPRLRVLAESVTAGASGTLAKATALEQHLRTRYQYTYETAARQNHTPLDEFLFESRRGHCEFFASALAMMLRAVGIPSRVATGFLLHEPNPITGFHEVRGLDGHAWVEAYLEGRGWLMLEPTPFYPLPRPGVERQVAEQMDGYLQRLAETRELLDPGSLRTQLTVLARNTWRSLRFGLHAVTNTVQALGWLLPLAMAGMIAGLLTLYLLGVAATDWLDNLRIRRTLDRLPAEDSRAATLLVGAALVRMTAPRSIERRQDWTLREYAQQLRHAAQTGRHGEALTIPGEFIDAFDAACYGASHDRDDMASLAGVIELVRARLSSNPWPRLGTAFARLRRMMVRG